MGSERPPHLVRNESRPANSNDRLEQKPWQANWVARHFAGVSAAGGIYCGTFFRTFSGDDAGILCQAKFRVFSLGHRVSTGLPFHDV